MAATAALIDPDTFEQTEITAGTLGPRARLLFAGMRLAVELLDGRPVNVVFPDVLELKVTDTAPPIDQRADRNFTTTKLENGIEVLVPQFVETGAVIRLQVETSKSMPGRMPGRELHKRKRSAKLCRS